MTSLSDPRNFARELRRMPTDAEIKLWSRCPAAKLIVEVDGGQHADEGEARTNWLEARGYRVVRFWNNDVLSKYRGRASRDP